MIHQPVLQKEVLEYLEPKSNLNFIDATFGEGGHSLAILEKTKPEGKILAIEIDPDLYKKFQAQKKDKLRKRIILVNDSYINLDRVVRKYSFYNAKGIIFDLGISMWHFKESNRGFTFQKDEILDMRLNPEIQETPAYQILNKYSQEDLEKIFKEFGEERFYKSVAHNIVQQRKEKPIFTTNELTEVIRKSIPAKYQRRKINISTKIFQALRIAVNEELENIKKGLEKSIHILNPGSRIVVISFHSLEDRIVKNFFREQSKKRKLKIITRKPITPSQEEVITNPSSRSAKMRVAELI